MDLETYLRSKILKILMPLTRLLGRIHAPYSKKKVKAEQYFETAELLAPGDVIMTRISGEFSNLFIPGKYKHGAIVADDTHYVIEATGHGVAKTNLIDFLLTKDAFVVLRPLFASDMQARNAAVWAESQIGKPYDYDFKSDNEAFYCFELSFAAYREALGDKSPWQLRETWGEPTVVGDDFLKAIKKWEVKKEFYPI